MNRVLQGRRVDEDGRKRYFDPRFGKTAVRVLPGEYYVTEDESEMIVTVLGSCISACIRDPLLKIGGMNHFMLPSSDTGQWGQVSAEMRYGNYAMEMLINDLMRRGARRDRLEFKLFGGAHIGTSSSDVGDKNIRFVRTYMRDEGFDKSDILHMLRARKGKISAPHGAVIQLLFSTE